MFEWHVEVNGRTAEILNDLVIARIAHPASKLESFEFISDYFGINHSRRDFYRVLEEKTQDQAIILVIHNLNRSSAR